MTYAGVPAPLSASTPPRPAALQAYPIVFETPVAWGEMDAFQHVNNVVYFKYFESARIAYFQHIGLSDYMKEHHIGPILASTSCRFRRPLAFPDTVQVGARVHDIETDRFQMSYLVYSNKLEAVAAEGKGLIVCYDYQKQCKTAIPEVIRQAIEQLQASSESHPA